MIVSKMLFKLLQIVILILIIMYFNAVLVTGRVTEQNLLTGPNTTTAVAIIKGPGSKSNDIHDVPLGVMFEQHTREIQEVFRFAMFQNSNSKTRPRLDFQLFVDVIHTADVFKLSRLICNKFSRGVVAMLGAIPPDSFNTLHSYTNTFEIPFITSWFPEKIPSASKVMDYAVSLRPDYHQAIIDTVVFYGWKHIIYIYDSHDGLLRLQQLFQSLIPGKAMFQISHVKRVSKAIDVTSFLILLEQHNRWSIKHVVLDCGIDLAKDAIVHHVRNYELGRRNYHYLLTGLVMDEAWEKDVVEYGAINITGFRILDPSSKLVRNFMELWPRDSISAPAALMYDAVQVLIDSMLRMLDRNPEFLRGGKPQYASSHSNVIHCNPNDSVVPYEYGEKMSRVIKRTDIEGITGHIRFNERGHRRNYSLQVMEMTVTGDVIKIGTWHDLKGFMPLKEKLRGLRKVGYYDRKKTYIVSTIVELPYVNKEEVPNHPSALPHLTGFCIDVTKLVLEKMEIPSYEIRLVKDGNYGSPNSKEVGGWDGLVGELVRNEADLVVAPLVMSRERQEVIDFSTPFLSFDDKPKESDLTNIYTIFSFFTPLSKEIWLGIVASVIAVSLCMFLVTKFSPRERRVMTVVDSQETDRNDISVTRTRVVNEFSLRNAIWFALGSFLQQGYEISPRSIPGRIVSAVWFFFALIVVATYTANMASNLTVDRINEPLQAFTKITKCPQDQRTPPTQPPSEGEDGDHPWMGFVPSSYFQEETPCELVLSNSLTAVKEFAVAFPKGSKLRDGVNLALQALKEEGELQRLVRLWFIDTKCAVNNEIKGKELTLSQFAGLFYILIGGLIVALFSTLMEFIIRRQNQAPAEPSRTTRRGQADRNTPDIELTSRRGQLREEPNQLEWNDGPYPEYYASQDQLPAAPEVIELQPTFSQV